METERINLEDFDEERYPGGWADVKVKRPYSAARQIESAGMRVIPKDGADLETLQASDVEIVNDTLAEGVALLGWHIVAWSLMDEDGQPIPVGRDGVLHEDFDDDLGEWLTARIEQIVAARRRSKRRLAAVGPGAGRSGEQGRGEGLPAGDGSLPDRGSLAGSLAGDGAARVG